MYQAVSRMFFWLPRISWDLMSVSQCGGWVSKSISFLKWTMFRGFGDLEFWNIPISYFFLFFELLMRQYDAALTMVSWTIHWISTHWHITSIIIIVSFAWQHYVSMATLCLCYCYQVISMYFPKSSRKTRHILELCSFCPDLFQVDQEVIVDRPGSRREVKLAMKMPFRH